MINTILLYAGAIIITLWGIAHIVPTKSIVRGFGDISLDNKRTITMEWIAEGLTLCFIGLLVFFVTLLAGPGNYVSVIVYYACITMLIVLAVLSFFTGARTSVVPMKICPFVKLGVALLIFLGNIM
jgi:hypothetical protein